MMDEFREMSGLSDKTIIDFLDIKKEYRIIDVGGRDGFFSKKMLEKANDVTVLDLNDMYFDELKKSGIKTIKADICDYSSGSFDLVFMSNVYHDLVQECGDKALKNISKIAKRYIAILDFKPEDTLFGPPVSIRLSKERVISDMQSIGFKLVKERELRYHYLMLFERKDKN
ncbi:MAG: class I SAM-dependent methyltransferase [Candidatus Parvarchaeota archaeon]|jgi:SAM-dependent methyltransferase|nr:class I SAM-dependent methyltransferase [Candidatus Parvarchaeota archaeon]